MRGCEEHRVDYVFGLARNSRLEAALGNSAEAVRLCLASGKPARVFRDFRYRTRDSWCRKRRVVSASRYTPDGANPRLVVTLLKHARMADPRALRGPVLAPVARPRTALASSSNRSPIVPRPPP